MNVEVIQGIGEGPTWIPPNPVLPPASTPLPYTPLPPTATAEPTTTVVTEGWNVEKFGAFIAMAGKLQKDLGITIPGAEGLDLGKISQKMAQGALLGAPIAPPIGSIVGAAIFLILEVMPFLQPRPSPFANAGVNNWCAQYAPTAFVEWVIEQNDGKFPMERWEDASEALLLWWLYTEGLVYVSGTGNSTYSGIPDEFYLQAARPASITPQAWYATGEWDKWAVGFYRNVGVDYKTTQEIRQQTQNFDPRLIAMHKVDVDGGGGGRGVRPPVTVDQNPPPNLPANNSGIFTALGVAAAVYNFAK